MKFRILPLILFVLFTNLKAQFTTPGTGVRWTLDSIALHSPATVTVEDDVYTLNGGLLVSENDSLLIDKNLTLKIAPEVEVEVEGYFSSNADEITITAVDTGNPYEGFWFYETAEVYFNHTLIEYGGGLKVVTPNFMMENCEVSNNTSGSSTGGAISFSNGSPVVQNSVFKFNENPALSSGANTSVSAQILNNQFEGNNTTNNNRPQLNMGPSGEADSIRIINNSVIGNRDLTMVGGISASSLIGVVNKIVIDGNTVRDNRYGIASLGTSTGVIRNNIIEDNDTEGAPMNGGSGINLFSTDIVYVTNNQIRRNLWGITLQGTAHINLGSDDPEDFNPGGNVFSENGNGGVIYALYNNTPNEVKALHNCWIEGQESTYEQVEEVITHFADDETLGEVFFDPFDCWIILATDDLNQKAFSIYPNPAKNSFFIETKENGKMKIYDLNGKLIQSENIISGKNQIQIRLAKGVYVIEVESNGTKSTEKLIVQ
jgi:parallel beta-helix repeat protein